MEWRGARRKRRLIIAAITVVVLGSVVLAVRAIWPDDRARAVDPEVAVERYREGATTLPATSTPASTAVVTAAPVDVADPLPASGVYVYATSGTESVDLLGGASHTYPDQTTVTVTADGCGVLLRWDLLVERRDEWRLCRSDRGVELQPVGADYHEFFGTGRLQSQQCTGTVVLVPADGRPRPPVEWQCTIDGRDYLPTWEVLGRSTLVVDGQQVDVTHVRMTVENDDHYYEHTVIDWWLDQRGLPVSMTGVESSRADSGVIGDVVYEERYRADLTSLTPLT